MRAQCEEAETVNGKAHAAAVQNGVERRMAWRDSMAWAPMMPHDVGRVIEIIVCFRYRLSKSYAL